MGSSCTIVTLWPFHENASVGRCCGAASAGRWGGGAGAGDGQVGGGAASALCAGTMQQGNSMPGMPGALVPLTRGAGYAAHGQLHLQSVGIMPHR